ncbi:MAG TPA: molybdenum ABC transporter ATP-binding protein [Candidatus Sulfotelmatobacter sp.]|jgi:molybdate transport system ATP-binding protein|nr:molybdenum ABC transporter ATP-binding protein [Candidatus Sulfotelmatobacter sp.]
MSIELSLDKRQGDFHLDVAFRSEGGITALFGRSGAGKSSLVAMAAGLSRPDRGRIAVGGTVLFDSQTGVDLPPERRRVGLVFQDGRLFPHLSVASNLRYGENLVPAKERWASFARVVELLGIGHLLDRRPAKLSGGEKQRVAIGRALLSSPRLLLMDEPLAALDGARKKEVLPFIAMASREFSVPILYVSHSIEEIIELADHLVVLEDGKALAAGELEEVLCDLDLSSITGRLDAGSILLATVMEHVPTYAVTRLSLGDNFLNVPLIDAPVGARVRVRIGAQDVALALEKPRRTSIQNILAGSVSSLSSTPDGQADVHVEVAPNGGGLLWTRITAIAAAELGLKRGDPIYALIKSASIARAAMALRP